MSETKWVNYAIAKDVIGGKPFICEFPDNGSSRGFEGDRVTAVDGNGGVRVGDIIYSGFDRPEDGLFRCVTELVGGELLKAVKYWRLRDVEWPEEEKEGEDAVS